MTAMATVGELVVEKPGRARVFDKYGIDYCCGGKIPLEEACQKKGIEVAALRRELDACDDEQAEQARNWATTSMKELADDIENTHHAYLKEELPRLERLVTKVAAVHGANHPELIQVHDIYLGFKTEMEIHMQKEEKVFFPMIRNLEKAEAATTAGSVKHPIAMMIKDHDDAGEAMEKMRALTHDYTPPADGCNSYRAMLSGLAEIEADTHQHVHKENNILFPRAAKREAELAARA